jgi:hypothetical protein
VHYVRYYRILFQRISEHTSYPQYLFPENRSVDENVKIYSAVREDTDDTQHGACALHAGYLRLHTQTENIKHLLLFDGNNG